MYNSYGEYLKTMRRNLLIASNSFVQRLEVMFQKHMFLFVSMQLCYPPTFNERL